MSGYDLRLHRQSECISGSSSSVVPCEERFVNHKEWGPVDETLTTKGGLHAGVMLQ